MTDRVIASASEAISLLTYRPRGEQKGRQSTLVVLPRSLALPRSKVEPHTDRGAGCEVTARSQLQYPFIPPPPLSSPASLIKLSYVPSAPQHP